MPIGGRFLVTRLTTTQPIDSTAPEVADSVINSGATLRGGLSTLRNAPIVRAGEQMATRTAEPNQNRPPTPKPTDKETALPRAPSCVSTRADPP